MRRCEWALERTAIRCEETRNITQASSRYQRLGSQRLFISYLTYNPATGKYELLFMSHRSAAKSVDSLDYDAERQALTNVKRFELSWRNETMESNIRRWFVSRDEQRERQDIKSTTSDFSEVYEIVFRRAKK